MKARLFVSLLFPFVVCALQWWLWDYFTPYVFAETVVRPGDYQLATNEPPARA